MLRLCLTLFGAIAALDAQDPREIIRLSVEKERLNAQRVRNYTCIERTEERELDKAGEVKSVDSETWDVTFLAGRPYRRLIAKNDKPLSPAEEKKQLDKLARETEQRRRETPEQRGKREAEYQKEREERRRLFSEVPDAYNFQLLREELVEGRPVYVISAKPLPEYRPRDSRARILAKIEGSLWIDKEDLQWVRMEATTIGTISFGWFLARFGPGARIYFEQSRVNDEVWLPQRAGGEAQGRLAILKKLRGAFEVSWTNYRKFQVDSKVVSTAEIP